MLITETTLVAAGARGTTSENSLVVVASMWLFHAWITQTSLDEEVAVWQTAAGVSRAIAAIAVVGGWGSWGSRLRDRGPELTSPSRWALVMSNSGLSRI